MSQFIYISKFQEKNENARSQSIRLLQYLKKTNPGIKFVIYFSISQVVSEIYDSLSSWNQSYYR